MGMTGDARSIIIKLICLYCFISTRFYFYLIAHTLSSPYSSNLYPHNALSASLTLSAHPRAQIALHTSRVPTKRYLLHCHLSTYLSAALTLRSLSCHAPFASQHGASAFRSSAISCIRSNFKAGAHGDTEE